MFTESHSDAVDSMVMPSTSASNYGTTEGNYILQYRSMQ